MLEFNLIDLDSILILNPQSPLLARDFAQVNEIASRYLHHYPRFLSLLIQSDDPSGWEELVYYIKHMDFDSTSHRIRQVAIVSDQLQLRQMPDITEHFSHAEIRHFPNLQQEDAYIWLAQAAIHTSPTTSGHQPLAS